MSEQQQDPQRRMYMRLKRIWMREMDPLDEAEQEMYDREFEAFIDGLIQMQPADYQGETVEESEPISQGQLMLEVILELDQTLTMVPPRVKSYRDLLVEAGLDRTSSKEDDAPGQQGMAGINLADQASLEFHSNLLGMAFGIAKDAVVERVKKRDGAVPSDW